MLKTILGLILLVPLAPQRQTFTLSGTVKLDGPVPAPKPHRMLGKDPGCCALHLELPPKDDLVVDAAGGVRWTLVYLKKGVEGNFKPPAQAVQVDQVGCIFAPHVVGAMAGQDVDFKNSDPMLHNIHGFCFANPGFNFAVLPGASRAQTLKLAELPVKVACDVHPFMAMYIGVFEHPFFAVTDAAGKFEIKNLPAGNYTVGVWHERLKAADREVAVKGAQAVEFTLVPK